MRKLPLILMLLVLVAPFAVSFVLLDSKQPIADKAKGQWLDSTHYVAELPNQNWQILWREQDCVPNCAAYKNLLSRLQVALGKNQTKVSVESTQLGELSAMKNGLFIANQKGLVLLSYQASETGAYNLLKDMKVLMKNNSN